MRCKGDFTASGTSAELGFLMFKRTTLGMRAGLSSDSEGMDNRTFFSVLSNRPCFRNQDATAKSCGIWEELNWAMSESPRIINTISKSQPNKVDAFKAPIAFTWMFLQI